DLYVTGVQTCALPIYRLVQIHLVRVHVRFRRGPAVRGMPTLRVRNPQVAVEHPVSAIGFPEVLNQLGHDPGGDEIAHGEGPLPRSEERRVGKSGTVRG